MKVPITDMDYVELYAEKMKVDSSLFKQQKKLIESQMKASVEVFSKAFCSDLDGGASNFKLNARNYLRGVGLI